MELFPEVCDFGVEMRVRKLSKRGPRVGGVAPGVAPGIAPAAATARLLRRDGVGEAWESLRARRRSVDVARRPSVAGVVVVVVVVVAGARVEEGVPVT